MLIIWGIRRKAHSLAMIQLACRNGHVAAHSVVRITTWFTLFFIPLIPVSRKYRSVCGACGLQLQLPKEEATALIERAGQAAGQAPSPDPVSPPLPLSTVNPVSDPGSAYNAAPSNLPPAGWYPDPAGSSGQRWWDGRQWTEAVQAG